MNLKIKIEAIGPQASGKSLAIADMIAGLKEGGHFHVNDQVLGMHSENEEYREIELRLMHSMLNPIEHES